MDMFFVISGFLITKMRVTEIETSFLSVSRFYKNRVVRLSPNLFLMIAASVLLFLLIVQRHVCECLT